MVVILTPGGFEQCVQTIRNSPSEQLEAVAASYGCYIDQRHTRLTAAPYGAIREDEIPIVGSERNTNTT